MIKLVVHGAAGRMGQRLCALAEADNRFALVGSIDRDDKGENAVHTPVNIVTNADVIIDFSTDDGARYAAALARETGASLLVGTTGLLDETRVDLDSTATSVAVMIASNTSRGVAILNHLAAEAARLLGDRFEIDLFEQHHRAKIDAPSGTALRLLNSIEDTGRSVPEDHVHCVRSGDIVGEHELQFTGPGERVRIAHSAVNRDVFVLGALDAAAWLMGRDPGMYTIEQSLGLTEA